MSINNIGPQPVIIEVYILHHFTINGQLVSSSVHTTYERALKHAVNTAVAFMPNLVMSPPEFQELQKLSRNPETYGKFLERYSYATDGERFDIRQANLEY